MATTELVRADRALKPASKARIRELLADYRKESASAGRNHHVPLDLLELHEVIEFKAASRKRKPLLLPEVARKALATAGTSPVVSRVQWGARAPRSPYTKLAAGASVTDHYEGPAMGTFPHSSCASKVRGIQAYHMDHNRWNDIAYNAVVCPHGYIFVCRWLNHRSAAQGTVTGNDTSYAVCFLGGVGDEFTDEAKRGFLDARAHFMFEGHATGETFSHSDWHSTGCPGVPIRTWEKAGSPPPAGYFDPAPTPVTPPTPTSLSYRVADVRAFLDDPSSDGGWMVDKNGGVYTLGPSGFFGSLGGVALNAPIVGGIATPTGKGYTLFGADGGVFTFGDAPFRGTYAALGSEYAAGQRAIIGGFFRGSPADPASWSYTLISDRLEAYAI